MQYGSTTNCKVRNGQTRSEYECRIGYEVISQSIVNNTSEIKLRLECRSINSSYQTKGSSGLTTYIDGTKVKDNAAVDMSSTNVWQNFGERTITVTHNSDGTYSSGKSGSFTCSAGSSSYSLASGSASVTVNPPQIPRYAEFTEHKISSVGLNSLTVTWDSNSTIDAVQYKLGSGDWVNTSGKTYVISGLSPNTEYTVTTRIKRSDSQLWTESSPTTGTTYNKATITNAPDFNFGDSPTITKNNPSGETNNLRLEVSGVTKVTRSGISDNYQLVLTDEEWDSLYKLLGDNNSLTITYALDTVGASTYTDSTNKTLTLTGNQKTTYTAVSSNVKRAKVFVGTGGTVKRAVVWIGNNGRKRCI